VVKHDMEFKFWVPACSGDVSELGRNHGPPLGTNYIVQEVLTISQIAPVDIWYFLDTIDAQLFFFKPHFCN
jgi:hypothetical protein